MEIDVLASKAEMAQAAATKAGVSPLHPASILRRHERAYIFLDADAASLLE
jgi:6-phosphogluconolactonase/glucosamine-6-phosphate isomerase/deaminase